MGQSLRFEKITMDPANTGSIFTTFASDYSTRRKAAKIPVKREYFDALLEREGLSLRGLAKRMGMSHSQLSLAFSGNRKLTLEEAARLSFMFGEPLHRVAEHAGVAASPFAAQRVPIIGDMDQAGVVTARSGHERVAAPCDLPATAVGIQCKTQAGTMWWADGAVLFCADPRGVDPGAVGRLSMVKVAGGQTLVTPITRGYRDGTFNLAWTQQENAALEWAVPIIVVRN